MKSVYQNPKLLEQFRARKRVNNANYLVKIKQNPKLLAEYRARQKHNQITFYERKRQKLSNEQSKEEGDK